MNDLQLFKKYMRSLEKDFKLVNVKLKACNDHVYYRAKERNIAWTDVYGSLNSFIKHHLCELLFQLNVTSVSTVMHISDQIVLVLGLYENTIVLRTVLTSDMKTEGSYRKVTYI